MVRQIETQALDEAFRQAQGHEGIIGPLAGFQFEGAVAGHIGDGCKAAR